MSAQEAGPVAMGTYDSSVYLGWIRAMGDVLMSHSLRESVPGEVIARYGGLMAAGFYPEITDGCERVESF